MSPAPIPMGVATDVGVLRFREGRVELLLIKRGHEPFKGLWALPGGFVEPDEDLPTAAARELKEETDVDAPFLVEFGAFGDPKRDPRGRTVSIIYYTVLAEGEAVAGDDAAGAAWYPLDRLPPLAFDHPMVIARLLTRFRQDILLTHVGFAFAPAPFDLTHIARAVLASGGVPETMTLPTLVSLLKLHANLTPASGTLYTLDPLDYRAPLSRPLLW